MRPLAALLLLSSGACSTGTPSGDSVPRVTATVDLESGRAPLSVEFDSTVIGGDDPILVEWDFGDEVSASGPSVVHRFELPGDFLVRVRATDLDGDYDEYELMVEATPSLLGTIVTASPQLGDAPLAVQFAATIAGGRPPYIHAWNFQDGNTDVAEDPQHTFQSVGDYDASYLVTDADGKTSGGTVRVTALAPNGPLRVSILKSAFAGKAVLRVDFDANTGGGRAPYSYLWSFGDGGTSTDKSPTHVYEGAGTFDVMVTAGDADNNVATDDTRIAVAPETVVINEILYDNLGDDTRCFIELKGPAGQSLAGYSLIGVRGVDGQPYVTIDLSGYSLPADGYFVIGQSGVQNRDLTTLNANLDNSPDNLELRSGTTLVDAVGYGVFKASDVFSGEGNPAATVFPDSSIGRDTYGSDTDNNGADFEEYPGPTPGVAN